MTIRTAVMALTLSLLFSAPASANDINPWGVWGDGAQIKKSKQTAGFSANNGGLAGWGSLEADQQQVKRAVQLASGGPKPSIAAEAPQTVSFSGYKPGSVVIDTSGRKLYYVTSASTAYRYPVTVGKQGFTWSGTEKVSRIANWPEWNPPAEMRQRKPNLPVKMTGGIYNPLGAKAIYLGNTLYRIHGTNDASSIGTAQSSGCIRMHNGHVVHLASLVHQGTTVHVLRGLSKGVAGKKAKGGQTG